MRTFKHTLAIFFGTVLLAPSVFAANPGQCAEYGVGEVRVFNLEHNFITHILPTNEVAYSVRRVSADTYQLGINPRYQSLKKDLYASSGQVPRLVLEDAFKSRVAECFTWFNQQYGQKLTPKIELALKEDSKPIYIRMEEREGFRSDSRRLNRSEAMHNCTLIVHESFHLMGLYDEYKETADKAKGKLAYDCRSRSDSIMANSFAYEKPFRPSKGWMLCACPSGASDECVTNLTKLRFSDSLEACPEETIEVYSTTAGMLSNEFVKAHELEKKINDDHSFNNVAYKGAMALMRAGDITPPLRAAHLRQLLFPTCETINPVYRACIKNAYVTSNRRGVCPAVPDECSHNDVWLE